jgi:hypothetical protein
LSPQNPLEITILQNIIFNYAGHECVISAEIHSEFTVAQTMQSVKVRRHGTQTKLWIKKYHDSVIMLHTFSLERETLHWCEIISLGLRWTERQNK